MTDEAIIYKFMGWSVDAEDTLELADLWEVEETLIHSLKAQDYTLALVADPDMWWTWHANAEQKIKALAIVLRPLVEGV